MKFLLNKKKIKIKIDITIEKNIGNKGKENTIYNLNKDNNIDNNIGENINNKMNKDNEINFDEINKCYYKEENSFLDFDNFSEIDKSSTSLKNTDKKKENMELKTQEDNTNKKELPDKILNKSLQKNQDNIDDICNIRYLEEEENNNTKEVKEEKNNKNNNNEEDKNKSIKESIKLSENEINRRLNFFDDSSTLPKKEQPDKNNNNEDDDDLVQEKPDDSSDEDNINIKDESNINENINNEEDEKEMKNNIEKELHQNMKESETLKDSYCDKLIKNMDEYRKMVNSNES